MSHVMTKSSQSYNPPPVSHLMVTWQIGLYSGMDVSWVCDNIEYYTSKMHYSQRVLKPLVSSSWKNQI